MLKTPAHLHDTFFKNFMSEPKVAGKFLREHLPAEVAALFTEEPPTRVEGSFVDEELAHHHSDLLFTLKLKTGDDALAYLLLEHKSAPDAGTPLQLLRYIVRILAKCYDERGGRLPLPVVLPLVAHQGPGTWKFSTQFFDMFGTVSKPLHPYLVSFRHALVDLPRIHDDALSADIRIGAYLKALKYGRHPDLPKQLARILVPELRDLDLSQIIQYVRFSPTVVSLEALQKSLQALEHNRQEKIMENFTWEIEAIGVAKGQARALLQLLEMRFGTISTHVRSRLMTADLPAIEEWLSRVLDAPSLNAIFDSTKTV